MARGHGIGQLAIVAVVVLALIGVFDDTRAKARVEAGDLAVEVTYPSRLRVRSVARLDIAIIAGRATDEVRIEIGADYLDGFSRPTFIPDALHATGSGLVVQAGTVAPGEPRIVSGELTAERSGSHDGRVRVTVGGEAVADIAISTFVLP